MNTKPKTYGKGDTAVTVSRREDCPLRFRIDIGRQRTKGTNMRSPVQGITERITG